MSTVILDQIIGKTIHSIKREDFDNLGNTENASGTILYFEFSDGKKYKMCHDQDCCESVWLAEIVGELNDLIDSPLKMAEVVRDKEPEYGVEKQLWTFYKFATEKGYVTLRWCGQDNGYYSKEVSFEEVNG